MCARKSLAFGILGYRSSNMLIDSLMKLLLCFCSTQFISGSLVLFGGPHNMRNLHPRANSVSARLEISTDERLGAGFFWQPWVIYQNPIGWAYRSIKEVALPLWRVCMSFKGKATFTVSPRKNSTSRCCEDVKLILKKNRAHLIQW